ncbi:MAG: cupin domain-containing protein [Caldilineaceae bacterium]
MEGESGYYALRPSSEFCIDIGGRNCPHSSIYHLLTRRYPINFLHWLASEDIHILVDGGPLDYYLFAEDGEVAHVRLEARSGQWRHPCRDGVGAAPRPSSCRNMSSMRCWSMC